MRFGMAGAGQFSDRRRRAGSALVSVAILGGLLAVGCSAEDADRILREKVPPPELATTEIAGVGVLLVGNCDGEVEDPGMDVLYQNTLAETPTETSISSVQSLVPLPQHDTSNARAYQLPEEAIGDSMPAPYDNRVVRVHVASSNGGYGYLTIPVADIPAFPKALVSESPRKVVDLDEIDDCA